MLKHYMLLYLPSYLLAGVVDSNVNASTC